MVNLPIVGNLPITAKGFPIVAKGFPGKGQTNSKWFFQADDSSKKRTNEFGFLA
jgi:hypothetical protein